MAEYQIRELAHLTGIKAHTIRVWEQRYNLLEPKRTPTNIRFYCDDDLRMLLNVAVLCEHGYRISRIALMNREQLVREVQAVAAQEVCSQPHLLQQLVLATLNIDEVLFERTLDQAIRANGLEPTFLDVVYPFLERIGILWQTGTVNPAQEHMVSNLFRQKIIGALDRLGPAAADSTARRFVLYLPEGEMHELALHFMHYLLRIRGQRVTYLGQNLPTADLEEVCRTCRPDYLLTVLTVMPERDNVQQYINSLAHRYAQVGLLLYGPQVQHDWLQLPATARRFGRMNEFVEWVEREVASESAD